MSERPDDEASDFREAHLRDRDFLGVFAVIRRGDRILMVENERVVHGRRTTTWDLPGGQVEPGEMLDDALRRELREETSLDVAGPLAFLFVQEGERRERGRRRFAWRSFFFAAEDGGAEPVASHEIRAVGWFTRDELHALLDAPYHDSFREWLQRGGRFFRSIWND